MNELSLYMCSSFHQSLPGCNGLLLLVLDDFDDLLLVGRLLLPVKVKTGGIAEGGGTYNAKRKNSHIPFFCDAALIAVFCFLLAGYLSQPGEQTVYFLLLAGLKFLNLTHVPGG